jgi:hypothetical protein
LTPWNLIDMVAERIIFSGCAWGGIYNTSAFCITQDVFSDLADSVILTVYLIFCHFMLQKAESTAICEDAGSLRKLVEAF